MTDRRRARNGPTGVASPRVNEKVLRADAQRNLELILQAAAGAFAERGLDVGVADIARRAGVGTATIFRRFPTKDDLVAAVLESRLEEILAIVRDAAERPGGLDAVRALMEGAVEFQLRDRGFMDSVGRGRFPDDPRFAALRDEFVACLDEVVRKAQAAGEVRDDVQGIDLPVLLHALGHGALLTEETGPGLWRRYVDVVLDGLRPGAPGVLRTAQDCSA
jgi:AcrR family transcriptional regulator